jgi:hypothetical protein
LREALLDPHVEKWAFNAAFERATTIRGFGIDTPVEGWRCTMALAYMHSFTGRLEDVGAQMGIPSSELKLGEDGKRLIRLFCMPQKITAKNSHEWRDHETNPTDWQKFREYCVRDVEAENAIRRRLIAYPVPENEWSLFEIDQIINERRLVPFKDLQDELEISRATLKRDLDYMRNRLNAPATSAGSAICLTEPDSVIFFFRTTTTTNSHC